MKWAASDEKGDAQDVGEAGDHFVGAVCDDLLKAGERGRRIKHHSFAPILLPIVSGS
jgi:hypothetical protein